MALSKFSLYSIDSVSSYPFDRAWPGLYLPPRFATWKQEPVDQMLDGSLVYGQFSDVLWDFSDYPRGIPIAQYSLFETLRQANGAIRLETKNDLGQWVICQAIVDRIIPATFDRLRARASGVKVAFSRVVVVA